MTNKGIAEIPLFDPILPKMSCPLFGVTTVDIVITVVHGLKLIVEQCTSSKTGTFKPTVKKYRNFYIIALINLCQYSGPKG